MEADRRRLVARIACLLFRGEIPECDIFLYWPAAAMMNDRRDRIDDSKPQSEGRGGQGRVRGRWRPGSKQLCSHSVAAAAGRSSLSEIISKTLRLQGIPMKLD